MNHVASTLGVTLPLFSLSAREAVNRTSSNSSRLSKRQRGDMKSSLLFSEHRDSLLCVKYGKAGGVGKVLDCDDDDDDTVETLSSSSCEDDSSEDADSFSSTCSSMCTVSFAAQVVTQVHYRPRTLLEEKATLYYTDVEYRQFKRDYYYNAHSSSHSSGGSSASSRQPRREVVVKFSPQLVSSVWTYSDNTLENKENMFYSESDLQRFLDEFVSSLNQSATGTTTTATNADA
jgi:hypothetical protein